MGKVVLYISVSLDGFIARMDGDISWLDSYNTSGEDFEYKTFYAGIGTIIAGNNTYKHALQIGPWPTKDRLTYVVTHEPFKVTSDALILPYAGDLQKLVTDIKARYHKHIWLMGGANLIQSFLKEDLVDEMMLFVVPLLLGEGISLFGNLKQEIKLKLIKSKNYQNGILLSHYERK